MRETQENSSKPLDVLIIGAGMSGIGMACHLQRHLPHKSWRIVEARGDLGGTWDLFKYPGFRSDSDLFTFSYEFKPWTSDNAIAGADEIMAYIRETAKENAITDHIIFHSELVEARWDSSTGLWTVTLRNAQDESASTVRCRWIYSAAGYYNYDEGYRPQFNDEALFDGPVVHAQHWPDDMDVTGKRIAVIGSGATAVTLVPALAKKAKHVVQVQRTPSYVVPLPQQDRFANLMRRLLPKHRAHRFMRWRNARLQLFFFWLYQRFPNFGRWHIRHQARSYLPDDFPYDTHFNPPYKPWDQRLCVAPDGDFFTAISAQRVSMVTGQVQTFTKSGLVMQSGETVDADIIVLATGLNIKLLGGVDLIVDGEKVTPSEKLVFNGMMLDGVPNYNFATGYTNAAYTLRTSLVSRYIGRLLMAMDEQGKSICRVKRPAEMMNERPLLDFGAGYIQRSLDDMPKQGDAPPWTLGYHYFNDAKRWHREPVIHSAMQLSMPTTQQ